MTTETVRESGHPQWQLISVKPRGLFDVLKDPDDNAHLSTVRLPEIDLPGLVEIYKDDIYETCYFGKDGSDVLERYSTIEEARAGHERYRIEYGLE